MNPQHVAVFSDVDGCLLDAKTYRLGPASKVLRWLRTEGIPLVLCTTKTRSELVALFPLLGAPYVSIVEDGCGLLVPARSVVEPPAGARRTRAGALLSLTVPYATIRRHFAVLRCRTNDAAIGFGDLKAREIAAYTNLSLSAARRAKRRDFDEPFYIRDEAERNAAVARRFASAQGLRLTQGPRLFHLHGPTDKGRGARLARRLLERAAGHGYRIVALGDSALDAPLLREADLPVIVPRPGGAPDPRLRRLAPSAVVAPHPGPAGWAVAVREALENA